MVSVRLNGQKLDMEVDTGAAFSVISEATRRAVFTNETLHLSDLVLKTYTDECMKVKGTINMRVQYGDQKQKLLLVVVEGNEPSVFGRNWLKYLQLDWSSIFSMQTTKMKPLHTLLQSHQILFSKELGEIHPFTASLPIKTDATPRFFKPHPAPFAIKYAISQKLTGLEKQGTISPVKHCQWATPIVSVPKKDGKFCICGDYKVTLNQVLLVEEYSLPTQEESWQEIKYFRSWTYPKRTFNFQ